MRLSKPIRLQIVDAVLASSPQQAAAKVALIELHDEGKKVLDAVLSPEDRRKLADREALIARLTAVDRHVWEGNVVLRRGTSFRLCKQGTTTIITIYLADREVLPGDGSVVKHRDVKAYLAAAKKLAKIEDELSELDCKSYQLVNSCSSMKQLLAVWPDLGERIDLTEFMGRPAVAPVPDVEEINTLLDKG